MDEISLRVHAKINLTLEITGVNGRGYHELDMLCCSVSPHDEVTVKKAEKIKVTMDGAESGEENTAYRAALLVFRESGVALRVDIKKGIPSGAGLGGSSADASAVFFAAVKMNIVDAATAEKLCVKVGSDVVYMMRGGYCRLKGEGEKVFPLGELDFTVAIVQKEAGATTAQVYGAFDKSPVRGVGVNAVLRGEKYYNVLERAAISLCPAVQNVKDRMLTLYGNAVMTGSGSAVFSVVEDDADEKILQEKFSDCVFAGIVKTVPRGIEII